MLRRHFGIGEHEAMHVLPVWYVDMLLDGLRAEAEGAAGGDEITPEPVDPGEDDWDAPLPEWAKAWRDTPEAAPNPAGRD